MSRAVPMFDEHEQTGEWIGTAIGITTAPRGRALNRGPARACFTSRSGVKCAPNLLARSDHPKKASQTSSAA